MGCFGSPGGKGGGEAGEGDDLKSQKRRSDAITRQLQKDKQVIIQSSSVVTSTMYYIVLQQYIWLERRYFSLYMDIKYNR